jgi:hypothetical protein
LGKDWLAAAGDLPGIIAFTVVEKYFQSRLTVLFHGGN